MSSLRLADNIVDGNFIDWNRVKPSDFLNLIHLGHARLWPCGREPASLD